MRHTCALVGSCVLLVGAAASAQVSAPALPTGSITGVVVDAEDAEVPRAQVVLVGPPEQRVAAGADGTFRFNNVAAGPYVLKITAEGMEPLERSGTISDGQQLQLEDVVMKVAEVSTSVDAVMSTHDRADVEMKQEETQRLAGFAPNFYVSYKWDAAPLSPGQKFRLALRNTVDPANFVINAGIAGIQQATETFRGYDEGAEGYGKRLGADVADFSIGTFVGGAVFPALLHQDPRYYYKGSGSVISRVLYALSTAVICRGDNGRWQPNYSSLAGDIASGAFSNLYYPKGSRGNLEVTFENGALQALYGGAGNVVQEFLFKRMTPKTKGAGKP
jgi:hypothetical protein